MKAVVLRQGAPAAIEDFPESELMPGDLLLRVSHSSLNYKDGLAIAHGAPVVRRWPMIAGIDLAGTVEHSDSPDWRPGDAVVVNGWGMGETHLGAYAERARIPAAWPIRLPDRLDAAQAMTIGTAGYTAMLCLLALERHGLSPERGALLVTGASGGVGSVAVAIAARAGWHVVAATGRPEEADYLRSLGAAEVIGREAFAGEGKPLERERFAAAIDSVGGAPLARVLAQIAADGAVAACGIAGGMTLPAGMAPFILRGVALLGINCVFCPRPVREAAWQRLARDLSPETLATLGRTVGLEEVIGLAPDILAGRVRGRVVVQV